MKAALDSLKDVKANASDSKPAQDKKDAKQGTEDSKDSDKMTETNSVPKIDATKAVLLDAQKAPEDSALTE
ncbi:Uncharacterised protein [Streptococcus pneumoniae]|nr:Uncharacterised protein [Streptococcus pneumoniae]